MATRSAAGKRAEPRANPNRVIAVNRRARHEYAIEDSFEAGLVLAGTEVKSARSGRVSLADAFARIDGNEAWLFNMHIAPYAQGNRYNLEPRRRRKLLLHRRQISALIGKTQAKGMTLVPLQFYFRRGYAKIELGLGRGKKLHDKREVMAQRDAQREAQRALHERSRT